MQTEPFFYADTCDKKDYLIATTCGALAGFVDIVFVATPTTGSLTQSMDGMANTLVKRFAKYLGWTPRAGQEENTKSAISFLERLFKVNYDQRHSQDVGELFKMSTKNHHLKSPAHSPDLLGLFFSILNQWTASATFLDNGKIFTIPTSPGNLHGTPVEKLYFGVINWIGHLLSDFAGSSGSQDRGSGLPIPFFTYLQLLDHGRIFQDGKNRNTFSELAVKVFQQGYDLRHGMAMTIPVVLSQLLVSFLWALRHYFGHNRPLGECIPSDRHDDLRIMRLVASASLCLVDGLDATVRSGGQPILCFLRLNLPTWFLLMSLTLNEILIRLDIRYPLQHEIDDYVRVNQMLLRYLNECRAIDYDHLKATTTKWNSLLHELFCGNPDTFPKRLETICTQMGLPLPYKGDFDAAMQNRDSPLVFSTARKSTTNNFP